MSSLMLDLTTNLKFIGHMCLQIHGLMPSYIITNQHSLCLTLHCNTELKGARLAPEALVNALHSALARGQRARRQQARARAHRLDGCHLPRNVLERRLHVAACRHRPVLRAMCLV